VLYVIVTNNHFKQEFYVNTVRIISYLTINTWYLLHKYQMFNVIYEKISLYYEIHMKHISMSMGQNPEILVLKIWDVYLQLYGVMYICSSIFFQYVVVLIVFVIKSRDLRSKEHRGYGEKFGDHLKMWQLFIYPSVCNLSYCSN